jgi:hypothetical protein
MAINGFPRHWNLRDHIRRVHNDPGPTKSSASGFDEDLGEQQEIDVKGDICLSRTLGINLYQTWNTL